MSIVFQLVVPYEKPLQFLWWPGSAPNSVREQQIIYLFETGQGLKSKDWFSLTQIPCVVNVKQKVSPAGTTHQ